MRRPLHPVFTHLADNLNVYRPNRFVFKRQQYHPSRVQLRSYRILLFPEDTKSIERILRGISIGSFSTTGGFSRLVSFELFQLIYLGIFWSVTWVLFEINWNRSFVVVSANFNSKHMVELAGRDLIDFKWSRNSQLWMWSIQQQH